MAEEHLLNIDVFNRPETRLDLDAEALLVLDLFVKRKGSSPTSPDMGFQISRYRYKDIENNLSQIEIDFRNHCSQYLPHISIDEMALEILDKRTLAIGISMLNMNTGTKHSILFKVKEERERALVELIR